MKYFDEIKRAMTWISEQDNVLFVGQAVGVPGTFMFNTLEAVPQDQRLEFPVCESFQMQFSLGMILGGKNVVSIYPRLNFLNLAFGDMSNMVDKLDALAPGMPKGKLIIRSAVGPDQPVHPGHQHIGDFTDSYRHAFEQIKITRLDEPAQVFDAYKAAFEDKKHFCHLIIEVGNYYSGK